MKKTYLFLTAVLGIAALTSCQDQKDWDKKVDETFTIGNDTITEHNVVSIASIKSQYSKAIDNSSYELVKSDAQLKATIICNDEGGNLSQQLIVWDGTGYIIIGITEDAMYSYAKVGQEILLNLQGLYVGGYGANGQIGYPGMSSTSQAKRIGRMTRYEWYKHVKFTGKTNEVPDAIPFDESWTQKSDYQAHADQLVYAEGTFAKADGEMVLAEPMQVDAGNSVNLDLRLNTGGTLTIRTSAYSDFGSMVIPTGKVCVTGIITPYNNNQWQLMMRTAKDIEVIK